MLHVHARKFVYDRAGAESDVPMDELIPIGIFASRKPGLDELSNPLHLQKHRIRTGEQTILITVSDKPILAGIDPHHLLDWEEKEDDDNIEVISSESTENE
jgi:hypothetical protein